MSRHQRAISEISKTPHSLSIKVLRLSRPSFSYQFPLSQQEKKDLYLVDPHAALSLPTGAGSKVVDDHILTPLLTLPPSFGTAYVGQVFQCTLCANNELEDADGAAHISEVDISGVMQTPSNPSGDALELESAGLANEGSEKGLLSGHSLQRNVKYSLREEGIHVLAFNVSYVEKAPATPGSSTPKGRTRSFRKLYQFAAQQLLSIRTKSQEVGDRSTVPDGGHYMLEAQLENLGEDHISLEAVTLRPHPGTAVVDLCSWNCAATDESSKPLDVVLIPGEVVQTAFSITTTQGADNDLTPDGRVILGQLDIKWRSAVGDEGSLTTGNLTCKTT